MSSVPNRIEISAFPGGKRIAVTTSWDDGVVEDRRLVASFNEWGLKGTFNLNSGTLSRSGGRPTKGTIDAGEVAKLYAGHEVAIHTVSHPWLERLDMSQVATEVLDDRKALEDLVGYPVRGMAYPFGTYSPAVISVLRALGIVYCRGVESVEKCFPPSEPLAWAPTAHMYSEDPMPMPARWEKFYGFPRNHGVFYIWGHSYEFDRKNDWAALERIFKPMAGKPDVWYCTNIALFDYEEARKRLLIAANRKTVCNPSALGVTINVDGKLMEIAGGVTVSLV